MSVSKLLKRALVLQSEIEASKALYAELDKIIEQLVELGFKTNGSVALVDNFAEKHTAFRTTSFKRFELRQIGEKKKCIKK